MPKKLLLELVLLVLVSAETAQAATLPGFFNTGVDAVGSSLATGAVDPHYVLVASADPSYPGPGAVACDPIPSAYWFANNAISRWIAPATDENYPGLGTPHPEGNYTYRFTFDLTGYDPSTVVVTGTWGVDNGGTILLNGVSTGNATTAYNPLAPFSVNGGFVAGMNHLDFVVHNLASGGANPTGLRVQGLSGTADVVTAAPGSTGAGSLEIFAPVPNPAHASARFAFGLPCAGRVRIVVHDLAGRAVRTIADGFFPVGRSESVWDGKLDGGGPATSGIYFAEYEFGGNRASRRIIWMR